MPSCAFLTIADRDGWFIDDDLVHEPLRHLGWEVTDIPWTEEADWSRWDLVLIRSTWDYQADPEKFCEVLARIHRSGALLLNSLATVRWNIDKGYLFQLRDQGVEIIPTRRLARPNVAGLRAAAGELNADIWIMKPALGANSDNTFRIRHDIRDSELNELARNFRTVDCLVQPFVHSVPQEGEYSVVCFNGRISHAIVKRVRKGDFRVQEEHGGSVVPLPEPEPALIESARKVMDSLAEVPLYARVDMVRTTENRFALMELELIEPSLYFRFSENAASQFAEAIDRRFAAERVSQNA